MAERQLVLVTGKGGVGKTTLTAAYARASADAGLKTLVGEVTSDLGTRSSLLSLFGRATQQGEEPISLERSLDGVRVTPQTGHRLLLRSALRVGMLADAAMRSAALNRFLMAAPAFPEIGTLYQLVWLLRLGRYDRIVLDLPATGHAIGLAKLPRTVARVVPKGIIHEAITEGLDALTDATRTGVIVASLPEVLPVSEAFELADAFRELEVPVGAMVLNRVPEDPFTEEERQTLDAYIRARRGELLLGTRELRRLERALDAKAIFEAREVPGAATAELPVFGGPWPAVIRDTATRLVELGLAPRGKGRVR